MNLIFTLTLKPETAGSAHNVWGESMSGKFCSVAAWGWTVCSGSAGLGLLGQGQGVAGTLAIMSAAASLPPLWKKFASKGKAVPISTRTLIGAGAIMGMGAVLPQPDNASNGSPSTDRIVAAASSDLAVLLAETEQKIGKNAISQMDRSQYPKMFSKLGRSKFDTANELSHWAAVAVARSDSCDRVDIVGVSDKSDRKSLIWFVDCSNRERFMVTEGQAQNAFTSFDAGAEKPVRKAAAEAVLPQPVSAQWKDFDEGMAVSKCDQLVKTVAIDRGSVNPEWKWDVFKDSDTGRVTIERDFDAKNGFGGTISSRYQCALSADGKQLLGFSIRALNGWKKMM